MNPVFFNTQHSPIGAFSSFTLGEKGAKGGLAMEFGKPADQNVFIGLENARGEGFSLLPFYAASEDESTRFDITASGAKQTSLLRSFRDHEISRELSPGLDAWRAGDLEFRIHTPVCPAPDPLKSAKAEQKLAYAPALAVEIEVDNRKCKKPRRVFFGFERNDPYRGMRRLDDTARGKFTGIASGFTGIASNSPGVTSVLGFTVEQILTEKFPFNLTCGLSGTGLLVAEIPAGKKVTLNFAVLFHRGGIVTEGMRGSYYYTRFFDTIESVAAYALKEFPALKARGTAFDRRFRRARLNPSRRFMLAQAIHSYYGSTELLDIEGDPMWVVNEGEYRMMNTFDLTVDQLFFEMEQNPWTVANELDWFVKRYSYRDKVRFPDGEREFPGGLSFSHDMGLANYFSRPGYSVYEKAGLKGCFSHMTCEELVNWLVCGLAYEKQTGDEAWYRRNRAVFEQCLESLLRRDHPDPEKRDGVMGLDSSRCEGGSEITTYDSLDVSLGQARNNLYLAVKSWGVYVGLAALFERRGDQRRAAVSRDQAARAAATIRASADKDGLLPAILHEDVPSRIIPAIEGLIIPHVLGLREALSPRGPYGALIAALKTHFVNVLKPGVCLFPGGGWKISSTSDNSWLSKIYLCQAVAEKVLGIAGKESADKAHAAWLLDPRNTYWAWSDQILAGYAKGSKYYPRGVTAILWMGK